MTTNMEPRVRRLVAVAGGALMLVALIVGLGSGQVAPHLSGGRIGEDSIRVNHIDPDILAGKYDHSCGPRECRDPNPGVPAGENDDPRH